MSDLAPLVLSSTGFYDEVISRQQKEIHALKQKIHALKQELQKKQFKKSPIVPPFDRQLWSKEALSMGC